VDDSFEVSLIEDLFGFGHAQQQGAATDYAGIRTGVDAPGSPQIKNPAGSLRVSHPPNGSKAQADFVGTPGEGYTSLAAV
jgi:hypothetical protein